MTPIRVFLEIATRNLAQAKQRSALLSIAVAGVTMLLVLLLSLTQGITDNLITASTTLSAGHVNVAGFFKATTNDAAPIVQDAARVRKIVEENTPGLDFVIDRQRAWGTVVSPTTSLQSALAGIEISEERHLVDVLQLVAESEYKEDGRPEVIGDPARLSEPRTAVIFASQAKRLDVTIGDVLTLRSQTFRGQTNTVDVTIIAVARDIGLLSNFAIFVPKETILELYQLSPRTTGAVMVYLKDIHQAENVLGHLTEVLANEGFEVMDHMAQPFFAKFDIVSGEDWTGQKLDITTWEDEIAFLTWILTALDTISFFLISILAVIIAIGMMNTMWIAVRERTKELGTIRAIGMTRRGVLILFMLEATILGLIASTTGALVGAFIALSVNAIRVPVPIEAVQAILLSDTLVLAVRPWHVLLAILALTLWTGLSALWPSIRAARLQPVEAIHET